MQVHSVSVQANAGGQSSVVSISATSAQSAAFTLPRTVLVSPTVDCFYRSGANPTALSNGTDMFLFGGNTYRIEGLPSGHKLAFITTSATGSVYITPEA